MSRRLQAGDTDELAITFALERDPDRTEGGGIDGSWGSLELWVAGRNLTEHRDQAEGLHEAIRWYLRPILGWVVGTKRAIMDDLAPPIPLPVDSGIAFLAAGPAPDVMPDEAAYRWDRRAWLWRERHALSASRRGGILPEVVFRRVGDEIEISWDWRLSPSLDGTRFLEPPGVHRIGIEDYQLVIDDLEALAKGLLVKAENVQTLASDDLQLKDRLQQLLLDREPSRSSLLLDDAGRLGPLGLATQTLDPDLPASDAEALIAAASPFQGAGLMQAREQAGPVDARDHAWEQGYAAASALRGLLGLDGRPLGEVDPILTRMGVALRELDLSDASTRSLALEGRDSGLGPVVAVNRRSPYNASKQGQRASILQSLGHLLLDASPRGRTGCAHGSDWAPRHTASRANAFAAMMLVPSESLAAMEPSPDAVRELARRLGTSPKLLIHHAENLGRLGPGIAEALLEQLIGD